MLRVLGFRFGAFEGFRVEALKIACFHHDHLHDSSYCLMVLVILMDCVDWAFLGEGGSDWLQGGLWNQDSMTSL